MTAAVTALMTTRDETAEATGNRYRYSRIVDTAGHVVRVRIERDYYDSYSIAQVEVINGVKCWTHLLDEPVRDWWDTTPSPRKDINVAAVLAPLAERLLRRHHPRPTHDGRVAARVGRRGGTAGHRVRLRRRTPRRTRRDHLGNHPRWRAARLRTRRRCRDVHQSPP